MKATPFMWERILVAPNDRLGEQLDRYLRLWTWRDAGFLNWTYPENYHSPLACVAFRLANLRATDHCAIRAFLRELSSQRDLNREVFWTWLGFWSWARDTRITARISVWDRPLITRSFRILLDDQLGWLEFLEHPRSWHHILVEAARRRAAVSSQALVVPGWMHAGIGMLYRGGFGWTVRNQALVAAHAALLAAELDGDPWPVDPFDPASRPLRRVERDGRVIGAYSVGDNGVDDGGSAKLDWIFDLYGEVNPRQKDVGPPPRKHRGQPSSPGMNRP